MAGITEDTLQSLRFVSGAPLLKPKDKAKLPKSKLIVWSIIEKEFSDLEFEQKTSMWITLTGDAKTTLEAPAALMKEALNALPADEREYDFRQLNDRLSRIQMEERWREFATRQVGERKAVENTTPAVIKELCPAYRGASLVMDFNNAAFEAYYPAGRPTKSVSMQWTGSRVGARSPMSALSYCLDFLWGNHVEKGRVP